MIRVELTHIENDIKQRNWICFDCLLDEGQRIHNSLSTIYGCNQDQPFWLSKFKNLWFMYFGDNQETPHSINLLDHQIKNGEIFTLKDSEGFSFKYQITGIYDLANDMHKKRFD